MSFDEEGKEKVFDLSKLDEVDLKADYEEFFERFKDDVYSLIETDKRRLLLVYYQQLLFRGLLLRRERGSEKGEVWVLTSGF